MPKPLLLISAGPTQEPIDPVRYISNHSSGKMGVALARESLKKGFEVILVHGPLQVGIPQSPALTCIPVTTALEMRREILKRAPKASVIIMAAAVADYRVAKAADQKIKKTRQNLTLRLVKNPDILKEVGLKKKKGQVLVGFAAETQNLRRFALKKLDEKKCDFIIANNVSRQDIGFGADQNEVWVFSPTKATLINKASKTQIAKKILSRILPKQA